MIFCHFHHQVIANVVLVPNIFDNFGFWPLWNPFMEATVTVGSIYPSIHPRRNMPLDGGRQIFAILDFCPTSLPKSKVEIDLTSKSTQMYRQMFTGQLAAALHFTQKVAVILSHLLLVFVTWRVVVGCKSYIIQGRYGAQWEIGAPSFLQNSPYVVRTYYTSQTVQ